VRLDRRALGRALDGRAGGPLRLSYRAAVATELVAVTSAARLRAPAPDPAERAETAARVTVAVKTFERPAVARRLVRSVRRVFDGRIVVADDSRVPMASPVPGVDVLALPFDVRVSVGRNAALDAVRTDYVLVTDDDLVFTAATDVDRARRVLDTTPEVDLVGFLRVDLPGWSAYDHGPDALFPGHDPPLREWGTLVGGLPVRYEVAQASSPAPSRCARCAGTSTCGWSTTRTSSAGRPAGSSSSRTPRSRCCTPVPPSHAGMPRDGATPRPTSPT
jgi:beta-1,4-N-acetylgalactosaminyltransferase 2